METENENKLYTHHDVENELKRLLEDDDYRFKLVVFIDNLKKESMEMDNQQEKTKLAQAVIECFDNIPIKNEQKEYVDMVKTQIRINSFL